MLSFSSLARWTGVVATLGLLFSVPLGCSTSGDEDDDSSSDGGGGLGGSSNDTEQLPKCDFGDDEDKCGGYANQSCSPFVESGTKECSRDEDCQDARLCLENNETGRKSCSAIFGACAPRCGGDFDCEHGEHCDPQTGSCSTSDVDGLPFGASCDPAEGGCAGTCVEFSDGSGECEEQCRVGAASGCGQQALEGSGVSCAYFAYDLSGLGFEQGAGDTGICAQLCDCDDDCPGVQRCWPSPTGSYSGICTGGLGEEGGLSCDAPDGP